MRTCVFLCCFVFFTLWEQNWGGFSWKFFLYVLFLQPLLSLCELVASFLPQISPELPRSVPSCLSLGHAAWTQAVPGSLSPMGSYACVGIFKLRRILLKPAAGEGPQFVMVRKCSHSPIIWWSHVILLSAEEHCASQKLRCTKGSPWASAGLPVRCCQPFLAALVSPTGLGCLPRPRSAPLRAQSGGTSSALPWPCKKWHRK